MMTHSRSGIICTPPEQRQHISLVSLVVPMFNERDGLDALFEAIEAVKLEIGAPIEVICIDDGSTDGTYDALCQRPEPYIRAFSLSRNFGKETALSAGLDVCRGDVVIPVDADLQEPPNLIPAMIEEWQKGFDVVFAVRRTRSHDTKAKQFSARLFYKLFNLISESKIPENSGDFRLMDRAVVDAIRQMPERNRFMKGLLTWPGFSSTQIHFDRPDRHSGESKWKPLALIGLAIDGLTSFSIVPLRIASVCGAAVSVLAFLFALYVVIKYLLFGDPVQGYPSLMTIIALLGGMQLMALGIVGEYIGRIYVESKRRPLYIISRVHESSTPDDNAVSDFSQKSDSGSSQGTAPQPTSAASPSEHLAAGQHEEGDEKTNNADPDKQKAAEQEPQISSHCCSGNVPDTYMPSGDNKPEQ